MCSEWREDEYGKTVIRMGRCVMDLWMLAVSARKGCAKYHVSRTVRYHVSRILKYHVSQSERFVSQGWRYNVCNSVIYGVITIVCISLRYHVEVEVLDFM